MSGHRILVVEDDDAVFDLLDATLGNRGAVLTRARTHAELQTVLVANRFDAVLCDLSPIREDVVSALGSIREANRDSRIVVISGSADAIEGLPGEWNVSYVRKPFEIHEIVTEITKTSM